MPERSALQSAADVSFIDNRSIDDVRGELVADFESYMTSVAGQSVRLERASVHRMLLYAAAVQIYQTMQYIDRAGKQSLLKYSYADFLDNLGLLKGVKRAAAIAASTTLRFTLSAPRTAATGIPQGTRVASLAAVYFETRAYAEVAAGEQYVDVSAVCTDAGSSGNGLAIGEVSTMVDLLPYVASVSNLTVTEGGAEMESDEDLRDRIYLAPGSYSTAGSEEAYLYHAKKFSNAIGNIVATTGSEAGTVNIAFIMADGSTPGTEMIEGLEAYLRDGNIRPMTDLVCVAAPLEVSYEIRLSYYINRSESARAISIQSAVEDAVSDYARWQRSIGRDVNPSKLVELVMAAGAKRVTVNAPLFTAVASTAVAALSGKADIQYGGLEDD